MMPDTLKEKLAVFAKANTGLTILTGAGISAESNIPTFRGKDGYWTVGSKEYHPQEMATYAAFKQMPAAVWAWYLYRWGVCRQATPNPGHLALVTLEQHFDERFTLITQNVDGLHLLAGNSLERTFQIHGNVGYMRCAEGCSPSIYPLPDLIAPKAKGEVLSEIEVALLRCPHCGAWARPHVLWFDEYYDEVHFRFYSSLVVAEETGLLVVVGTSGSTNLPHQVAWTVYQNGGLILDVNPEANPFSQFAVESSGYFLQGLSGTVLPELAEALISGHHNL